MSRPIEGPRPPASRLDAVPRVDQVDRDPERRRHADDKHGSRSREGQKPDLATTPSVTPDPDSNDRNRDDEPVEPGKPRKGKHIDVKV